MTGRIKVIVEKDPIADALMKSLQKRLAILETLIKQNKGNKSDMKSLQKLIAQMSREGNGSAKFNSLERKTDSLLRALKEKKQPKFSLQIIPSPS